MRRTLIITGGGIQEAFALQVCKGSVFYKIIGVDKGLEFLYKYKISPTDIVGDFDSLKTSVLEHYQSERGIKIHEFPAEKDATDTEIALQLALEYESEEIVVLGATGTRVDHLLGNIQLLNIPLKAKVPCMLLDAYNKITLIESELIMKKTDAYGMYISLLPLTTTVKGLTLTGFKYPLDKHLLTSEDSLGISNELLDEEGKIEFEEGILIVIESTD